MAFVPDTEYIRLRRERLERERLERAKRKNRERARRNYAKRKAQNADPLEPLRRRIRAGTMTREFATFLAGEQALQARRERKRAATRRYRERQAQLQPDFRERRNAAARAARLRRREIRQERAARALIAIERGELPPGMLQWSAGTLDREQLVAAWEFYATGKLAE